MATEISHHPEEAKKKTRPTSALGGRASGVRLRARDKKKAAPAGRLDNTKAVKERDRVKNYEASARAKNG